MTQNIVKVFKHLFPDVELVEAGDKYKACCPFHEEKTPSLTLYKESDSWYCFGKCSLGGDIIDLIRNGDKELGFKQAKNIAEEVLGADLCHSLGRDKKASEGDSDGSKPMPKEAIKEFQQGKVFPSNYRGIRKEIYTYYKTLADVNNTGDVTAIYTPETRKNALYGYKCRNHPKDFSYGKVGSTGVKSDLYGQFRFQSNHKYVLITGGEMDCLAAYQMLLDHQKERGQDDYAPIPVVSPTSGEGGAAKQCSFQLDWFDKFDNILIGLDNDDAGRKAAESLAEVLPKEKVKIITWFGKDPNAMLLNGQTKQFIRDFYGAKEHVKNSIKTSADADLEMVEELSRLKVTLPQFQHKLQDLMRGGIPLGYIINIIAKTGIGKSSVINEMIYYWIFNSPYTPAVVSLELTAGQYSIAMLSRHLGKKISLIENPTEAVEYVNSPYVVKKRKELNENEYGQPRWHLLDDRENSLDSLMKNCELIYQKYGCKFIIIDPLQDALEGETQDNQLKFIKWQKLMVKKGITFINICHVRKGSNSTTKDGKRLHRELTEDDVHGISAVVKSGGANIIIDRDKYAESEDERNTTTVVLSKCRWTGFTGPAGLWYYDNESHTMYDKDDWLTKQVSIYEGNL